MGGSAAARPHGQPVNRTHVLVRVPAERYANSSRGAGDRGTQPRSARLDGKQRASGKHEDSMEVVAPAEPYTCYGN